jgi:hypothetical protein
LGVKVTRIGELDHSIFESLNAVSMAVKTKMSLE